MGFFALISVLFGRLFFADAIRVSSWLGLTVIVAGSLIMQFGASR